MVWCSRVKNVGMLSTANRYLYKWWWIYTFILYKNVIFPKWSKGRSFLGLFLLYILENYSNKIIIVSGLCFIILSKSISNVVNKTKMNAFTDYWVNCPFCWLFSWTTQSRSYELFGSYERAEMDPAKKYLTFTKL